VCGICGLVGTDPAIDPGSLESMSHSLRHRGPEEAGDRLLTPHEPSGMRGWFGHRRLKIVDLSDHSRQPMADDSGDVVISYNGEVYNFRELRHELETLGVRFRSAGDTEVVLRAYCQWGEGMFDRLDGMFAIAVWDARCGRLLLGRDRVGKKPLYYARAGRGGVAFGSEIKAVLACPGVERSVDWSRLGEFLVFGYVPHPQTLLTGVAQVPPGSYVAVDGRGVHEPVRYWDALPAHQDLADSPGFRGEVAHLLEQAVRRRLISDVPLGALLSGGIDSSLVVALMSRQLEEPVHTFSIGFPDEPSYDERDAARGVASHFGTRHTEFAVQVDAVGLLDRLLWHHDQPFADSSAIPTYLVCGLAKEHVTVVLNGDGGDEVFGGYDRFRAAAIARRLPPQAARAALALAGLLPQNDGYFGLRRRAQRFLDHADAPVQDRYQSWISLFSPALAGELTGRAPTELTTSMTRRYERAAAGGLPVLDQILYANLETYLPDDLAVKMDRMAMAHSLEARSPFLDTALIDYMARLPARRKVGLRSVKPMLRKSFGELLPDWVWDRPKHGFGVPVGGWLRGDLRPLVEDELLCAGARAHELVPADTLRSLYAEHLSGRADHGGQIWTLLTLERWLRSLERPLALDPPADSGLPVVEELSVPGRAPR
jgi:asparagine synthase (glutamine-hydrolysing)